MTKIKTWATNSTNGFYSPPVLPMEGENEGERGPSESERHRGFRVTSPLQIRSGKSFIFCSFLLSGIVAERIEGIGPFETETPSHSDLNVPPSSFPSLPRCSSGPVERTTCPSVPLSLLSLSTRAVDPGRECV